MEGTGRDLSEIVREVCGGNRPGCIRDSWGGVWREQARVLSEIVREVCGGNRPGCIRDSWGGLWREQVGMDER